jgi:hypothetical protein
MAGAQAATIAACVTSVLQPLAIWLVCETSAVGWPKNVRHKDGGMYNGEWSGGKKAGFGSYRQALPLGNAALSHLEQLRDSCAAREGT